MVLRTNFFCYTYYSLDFNNL